MNKHIIISVLISVISIMSIITSLNKISNTENITHLELTTQAEQYILKNHKGKLALFSADSPHPVSTYDIYVNSFPQRDIEALNQGIIIDSKEELQKVLEEYLS